jgi:hypothetical protein
MAPLTIDWASSAGDSVAKRESANRRMTELEKTSRTGDPDRAD